MTLTQLYHSPLFQPNKFKEVNVAVAAKKMGKGKASR